MTSGPPDGDQSLVQASVPIQTANDLVAAIYARTSSPSQRHGYSINEQVRQCWERCNQLGWTVSHVFQDEAVSGKDTDREMFQKLLDRAETGRLDVVIVWKLDRFSRSLMHAVKLERQLRDWDVGLHSVTEHIDTTTPTGRFNFRSISSASEFEREMTKQRSKMGLRAMAQQEKWPNDSPPLGYDLQDNGRLTINPEEAELVLHIFNRYIELQSMPDLADELDSREDIADREMQWTPYRVGEILKNQLYTGQYSLAGIEKHVEEYQILEVELFKQTTEVRNRFQRNSEATRSDMPEERKRRHVENIKEQYSDFLDSTG